MSDSDQKSIALVLAAHGDRGGPSRNEALGRHVVTLSGQGDFVSVTGGVLNGEPSLESALEQADSSGADQIIIYPMFMSAGYFVKSVLVDRVSAAGLKTPTGILQPFGLDQRVPLLLLESALQLTKSANLEPNGVRLLIAAHGSKEGSENADATKRAARQLSQHSPFARIETAFLEEAPFIADALERYDGTSVVAGFFTGDGMHAGEDIPALIEKSGAKALYTGPIGLSPRVPDLITSSVKKAMEDPDSETDAPKSTPQQAEQPPPPPPPPQPQTLKTDEASPAKAARKKRGGPVRFLMKAAVAVALLIGIGIAAVSFLVPEDVIRSRVVSVVKEQTGRTMEVKGRTSFALFPNVGVELENVTLSNPPGMASGTMLSMEALNINLKLIPLLSRQVEVDRIVLVKPVFNLLTDKEGRQNWVFGEKTASRDAGASRKIALHESRTSPKMMLSQAGGVGAGAVQDVSLGTVKIIDGALNYKDEIEGTSERLDAINVTLVQPARGDPLDADGSLVWKGEEVTFDSTVQKVSSLLNQKPSEMTVKLSTRHAKADFKGDLTFAPALSVKGDLKGETGSLRGLIGWLGDPLPPGRGFGPLTVTGAVGFVGETVTITKAKLNLDGMTGEGNIGLRLAGVRPMITAVLNFDKLDLNPYVQEQAGDAAPAPAAPEAPADNPPSPDKQKSLTDFIEKLSKGDKNEPKPQVRAWSQRAIDLTGLRAVDADVRLSAGAIHYRNIKTGESDVAATLKSGVLTANLTKMALYSGSGTGRITVNGARGVPAISFLFNLNDISALPLLKDAVSFNWVSGRANMAISLSGTGRSQSEIVSSLQGQGNFAFADGAIEGINIPAMVRGLKEGKFDGWKRSERLKTDFSQLTTSFQVQQGIAYNKDLKLVGPLIRMTGEGNIDLGREKIDYAALPRIVPSLEGQGAAADGKGLAVPIRITGSWDNPRISPDLQRFLDDPELAKETSEAVNNALEKLKNNKDVNRLLQGIFGGGQGQAPQQ